MGRREVGRLRGAYFACQSLAESLGVERLDASVVRGDRQVCLLPFREATVEIRDLLVPLCS